MNVNYKTMDKHWDKQYRDGGSISSDRRFTEWDFNKLMASDKFRAVWSGNHWEIIEEGRTTVLGKFNPKTKSLYISGDKNMDNFLVVWMTENGFVNSDEYAILANGGGVERIDLFEDYENIPKNVQTILDIYAEKFGDDFGNMDYKDMADMHNEIYAVGYTFDSYLDNQPYGLRPIGVSLNELKGYEDMGEEYANGGGVEYYKNSTIRKGTFGDDDFNPMDLPVTYRVYDENGKVVGKTTSFNNSGAIAYKLGYKAKIVATDKSGNERVIQDGVNSKGEQFAGGGGISKKSVISELKKLGYSNDNAEEIIEKHIDIYEINFDDKDTNARGIALAIDEQENQQDDYANGGGIKGKELWFSPYGEVKAEKRGTAKDFIEKNLAKSFGAEYMELVGEDEKDYIYELNGNPMMIAAKTAILQEETDLDIETYGRKKRVHIPKKSIDETSVQLRYPLITPFKNGGGVGKSIEYLDKKLNSAEKRYSKAIQQEKLGIISTQELNKFKNNVEKAREDVNQWYSTRPINAKEYANGGGVDYDTRWAEMEAYSPYTSRAEYENKKEYEELAFASKTFSKTSEILVRENLNNGEICMCKLTKILGHEPNYPIQIVGSLKLEKCFMKRFYRIV